jgi:hypothetical protein
MSASPIEPGWLDVGFTAGPMCSRVILPDATQVHKIATPGLGTAALVLIPLATPIPQAKGVNHETFPTPFGSSAVSVASKAEQDENMLRLSRGRARST